MRPEIKQFMAKNNIKDYAELQSYWRAKLREQLKPGRTAIFWRNGVDVPTF